MLLLSVVAVREDCIKSPTFRHSLESWTVHACLDHFRFGVCRYVAQQHHLRQDSPKGWRAARVSFGMSGHVIARADSFGLFSRPLQPSVGQLTRLNTLYTLYTSSRTSLKVTFLCMSAETSVHIGILEGDRREVFGARRTCQN